MISCKNIYSLKSKFCVFSNFLYFLYNDKKLKILILTVFTFFFKIVFINIRNCITLFLIKLITSGLVHINPFSAGIDFRRLNLTIVDVRF